MSFPSTKQIARLLFFSFFSFLLNAGNPAFGLPGLNSPLFSPVVALKAEPGNASEWPLALALWCL